ncbi:MAG: hypothetical protein ACOX52_08435 [Verrucomicrobiota bacterium]
MKSFQCVRILTLLAGALCLQWLSIQTAFGVSITEDLTIPPGELGYDNQAVVIDGCTVTVSGAHTFSQLTLQNGAVLTHPPYADGQDHRCWIVVNGDLAVDSSSAIDVNGRGYPGTTGAGMGPGGGTGVKGEAGGGGGGAYGGNGGAPQSSFVGGLAYGSAMLPSDWGSAGGAGLAGVGGAGGGVIHLEVSGTCTIDGVLRANGGNGLAHNWGASGGGSGGGIYVQAGTLQGAGAIRANGGLGYVVSEEDSGGGSGGRIALIYGENLFTGAIEAFGMDGHQRGGAGSIYTRGTAQAEGDLHYSNGGTLGAITPWTLTGPFRNVTVQERARLWLDGGSDLAFSGTVTVGADGFIEFAGRDQTLMVDEQWVGRGSTVQAAALLVDAGGTVTARGLGYTPTNGQGNGPGGGNGVLNESGGGAGAGYGGHGSAGISAYAPGQAYGSAFQPIDLGSAGGAGKAGQGGAGGGAIHIAVDGAATVHGLITADGLDGRTYNYGASGGGAGGSIWLECGTFEGSGILSASGGKGYVVSEEDSGAGAGGRIAVVHSGDSFEGELQAFGGVGPLAGGAGTVYLRDRTQAGGQLIVDNNQTAGADTPWNQDITPNETIMVTGSGVLHATGQDSAEAERLIVGGGSFLRLSGTAHLQVDQLKVTEASGILAEGANRAGMQDDQWAGAGVTIHAGTMEVGADCVVSADALGYTGTVNNGNGPGGGAGVNSEAAGGGGAGHGGNGGAPQSPYSPGLAYGSTLSPLELGSAGGAGNAGLGGAGGGAIHLIVDGELLNEGRISANGENGRHHNWGASGGGAGGSLWIEAGSFNGSGLLLANGGIGHVVTEEDSGGGAGGRIAVYCGAGSFPDTGTIQAYGGTGYVGGGNGTIYVQTPESAQLRLANASAPGAFTPLRADELGMDLLLREGARVSIPIPGEYSAGNVTVGDGAVLAVAGDAMVSMEHILVQPTGTILVQSAYNTGMVDGAWSGIGGFLSAESVTIEAGGVIHADGQGYTPTDGRGNGPGGGEGILTEAAGGAGAGHGGDGSPGIGGFSAGKAYGLPWPPSDLGSAGGAGKAGQGGAGGGAIGLFVLNDLVVDGVLSANGAPGRFHNYGGSGGGSGGSLWINVQGDLMGSGTIAALGGQGQVVTEEDSGGGAGGRIAISLANNLFTGRLTAAGAPGSPNFGGGGAGTILLFPMAPGERQLIIDNEGLEGAWTPLPTGLPYEVLNLHVRDQGRLLLAPQEVWRFEQVQVEDGGLLMLDGGSTLHSRLIHVQAGGTFQCRGLNRDAMAGEAWAGVGSTIVADDIQVDLGGAFSGFGLGYSGTTGLGNGPGGGGGIRSEAAGGGGGGHGGGGGKPQSAYSGGPAYGNAELPTELGSAGGAGLAGIGGGGGSAIRIVASNTLRVDGVLDVNGQDGLRHNYGASGGGAGGSLWIQAGTIAGEGVISANGGAGFVVSEEDSGAGGGGRIAGYFQADEFTGTISADTGLGGVPGGAGSIVWSHAPNCMIYPIGVVVYEGSVTFTVRFSTTVVGLEPADFVVGNGIVQEITQDGFDFQVTVQPDGPGAVTCMLVGGVVTDLEGRPNIESNVGLILFQPRTGEPAHLSISRGSGSMVQVDITGTPGATYAIQVKDAWADPWVTLTELTLEGSSAFFMEGTAGVGSRYFRAVQIIYEAR